MDMLYKNLIVNIPPEGRFGTNNRIYIVTEKVYHPDKQYNVDKRVSIGQAIDDKTMYPNHNYKLLFPTEYEQIEGKKSPVKPVEKSFGLKLAIEAICRRNGLYDCMQEAFGAELTDAFLDYAMYMVKTHSDASQHIAESLARDILFSGDVHSDSFYSRAFSSRVSEEQLRRFRELWANRVDISTRPGTKNYLCIDGTNNECEASGVEIAEKGHNKTGKNINVFNIMYAVTENGTPITYELYRGSVIDAKALKRITTFVHAYNINVDAFILDRGFCEEDCLDVLADAKLSYVMMLKSNVSAAAHIMAEHGRDIKLNVDYKLPGVNMFGLTEKAKLFAKSAKEAFVHLYYDACNGVNCMFKLMNDFEQVQHDAIVQLRRHETPSIPAKFKDILKPEPGPLPEKLIVNKEAYQQLVDNKGLSAIATSDGLTAAEANRIYHLRDASETQYGILKTQLGFDRARVKMTPSLAAKTSVAFCGSIIRNEIMLVGKDLARECKKPNNKAFTANAIIKELETLHMTLVNDVYCQVDNLSERDKLIMEKLGITEEMMREAIDKENLRCEKKVKRPRRKTPGRKNTSSK